MFCYDTETLRESDRTLPTPFQLMLDATGEQRELSCTAILRHLPGKRIVCRGGWHHHQPVVAKIFLAPSGAKRHYQRELQGIEALRSAEIPTPAILYKGTLADGKAPLLLFQEMQGYQNLTERLATLSNADDRLATMQPVVQLIGRLHEAGFGQRDIHPGNFLLSDNDVVIIDGDDIEGNGRHPLSRQKSLSNIALFFAQFYPQFDTIVPQLVDVYGNCRNWPIHPGIYTDIQKKIRRWRDWRQKKYLQKTKRACTAFVVQKAWHRFMACDRTWYSPSMQNLLNDPDTYIKTGTILKDGNTATVAKVTIASQTLVVKRYNIKNRWHALRRCLRPSRGMVSWKNAHRLLFLGIHTPRPLAVIEERWGVLRKRAYFIMAYLPGKTINQIIRAKIGNPQATNDCFNQLEVLLKQLAAAQIIHGDFKATNFLISTGQLYLVDLDGMHSHRSSSAFQMAFHKDLNRLQRNWNDLPHINQQFTIRLRDFIQGNG
jgi:tRNA A-37 threonylcarbamoyl transferase component Bud32